MLLHDILETWKAVQESWGDLFETEKPRKGGADLNDPVCTRRQL